MADVPVRRAVWGEPLVTPGPLRRLQAVRHGESEANVWFAEAVRRGVAGLAVETADVSVGLSPRGIDQAVALGEWLAAVDEGPRAVVCSPYARAVGTWEVMAAEAVRLGWRPVPAVVDERLRDRETGVFELMTPAAVLAEAPQEARRRARVGEWHYRPPGGESLADVALRVRDFMAELGGAARGGRVLVVAHDAIVVALRYVIAGLGTPVPDPVPAVPNASVSQWTSDADGFLRLTEFGGTAHLAHDGV